MARRGTSSNPFEHSMSFANDEEWEEEEEEAQPVSRTRARRTPPQPSRINPEQLSQRSNTPSGLPAPPPQKTRKTGSTTPAVAPQVTPSRVRAAASSLVSARKPAVTNPRVTSPQTQTTKPPQTPKKAQTTQPTTPKEEAQRGRRRGKTQASSNPLTSTAYSTSASGTSSSYPSKPPAAPYGYSSLYSSPTTSISSTTTEQAKNKIIPNLRAAGQRRMERGDARSIDQGTALEIVSKLVGRSISIVDIENDKKAAGLALFAQPTELVALFELAMRMVESHQFYSKTV